MRPAPSFWWQPGRTWQSTLLAPAGLIYGGVTAHRMGGPRMRLHVPVICIGNLVAGGAGKTPTALAVGRFLLARGRRAAFLSRGYGRASDRSGEAVIRVDPKTHDAAETGDEPLLLAARAPAYVSRDRIAAARRAIEDGADVLVLDDGLQNPALAKTFSIAVVDGMTGVGNGRCVPAGPLRAPLAEQWPHVSACCIIGDGIAGEAVGQTARKAGVPVWIARLVPDAAALATLRTHPLIAFAGIGNPAKFFATLRIAGLDIQEQRPFPDHHRFKTADLTDLKAAALRCGARLVTTEKDRVRLPIDFPVSTLPVALVFQNEDEVAARLEGVLREDFVTVDRDHGPWFKQC